MSSLSNLVRSGSDWSFEASAPEVLPTGIAALDASIEGCPRGRITEIVGPASSGRTSLLHAVLAEATRLGEFCAVVDATNAFDPESASAAGIDLGRLILVRCSGNVEHAMKAVDLLIHSGGFGVIALDLCEAPAHVRRRIPLAWWYRFRRAVENTPCAFVILEREPMAKACASLLLEMKRRQAEFTGTFPFQYFEKARFEAMSRKPPRPSPAIFEARALE
jgi:hypothetical protein